MTTQRKSQTETESDGRLTTFTKTSLLVKVLKWLGVIITLLTLAGFLVGYGIWLGSTSTTITLIKDDVKDLKDEDRKTAANLTKLLSKLNERLQGFEVILTKHQSSIDALRSEIRIRHEDAAYIGRIITYQDKSSDVQNLSRIKRQQLQERAYQEAQQRAARASDSAIGSAHKALPTITQDDPLDGLSF